MEDEGECGTPLEKSAQLAREVESEWEGRWPVAAVAGAEAEKCIYGRKCGPRDSVARARVQSNEQRWCDSHCMNGGLGCATQ